MDDAADSASIAQLGFVVDDIAAAMEHWVHELDVGPFFYLPNPPVNDLRYRGEPTGARMAVALSYSGPMQVELIQPLDDEPSPYRDFRLSHGRGLHHVARFTTDYDGALRALEDRGRRVVFQGRGMTETQRFCYFEPDADGGPMGELVESAGFQAFFDHVRDAAATWDGSDPVRTLSM
ncbi:MAG TPA: VOC family protein [Acidimicrobiales bacterium]|nr:VOC family protein [Acidimicrobiales bacterium]